MKLLVIVGKKRSGKDTIADYVSVHYRSLKWQLAMPIKYSLGMAWKNSNLDSKFRLKLNDWDGAGIDRETVLPINNEDVSKLFLEAIHQLHTTFGFKHTRSSDIAKSSINRVLNNNVEEWTIRRLMQVLGTDLIVDKLDRMYWVKLFAQNYLDNYYSGYDYYIVPDVRQVHEIDTLRAMGATVIHVVRSETDQNQDSHITEAGLPISPGDIVINNDSTLEQLFEKLIKVI